MTDKAQTYDPQEAFEQLFKSKAYREQLATLALQGKTSLDMPFEDVVAHDKGLAEGLIAKPADYLKHAGNAAMSQLGIEAEEYTDKIDHVNIRVYGLFEKTPIRKVAARQINKLVMIGGIVVKSTIVHPKALKAVFECRYCGTRVAIDQTTPFLKKPIVCEAPACERTSFDFVEEESKYVDVQDFWVQEHPDELPAGQLPRNLHIKALDDLVDLTRPGDNILVVGFVRLQPRKVKGSQLNMFDLFIEANSIQIPSKETEAIPEITEINKIIELAKDPWIHRKIIQSIAPSIYGYENIKEAIMYLLFGGVAKDLEDIKIRGELNAMLIGDPGVAKTQLLRYVSKLSPRGLFTTGQGATGVGLTATVIKDETGQFMLEAGALVLADKGVACIDEIDKMNPDDRVRIHETLESHTVSIAKGGIVATLNARTAVLAAANPTLGRYNAFQSVIENISLPVTLLSRFDLIFLMRDVPEQEYDAKLAEHILGLHRGGVASAPVPPQILRKYIAYSKQIEPALTQEAADRLKEFYLLMRKASQTEGSPIAIGARQLEGLVRIAEARARAALRKIVTKEDAEAAIRITMLSLQEVGIDVSTGKVDIDILMTGKPKSLRDKMQVVISTIVELCRPTGIIEKQVVFHELSEKYSIPDAEAHKLIDHLLRDGVIFEPREGFIKKI